VGQVARNYNGAFREYWVAQVKKDTKDFGLYSLINVEFVATNNQVAQRSARCDERTSRTYDE